MADLETQIVVKADSSGVATGLAPGKKYLKDFGVEAEKQGKKAGDALKEPGEQAEKSSKLIEQSTKRSVNALQREIAAIEAGSRKGLRYQQIRAEQSGADTSVLAPYFEQLKEVTAKQQQLTPELEKGGKQLNAYGLSAKQTAAAMRQVPAQLTDIIVGLQGGQAPLTVLLQQGGQLKDVFGGIAPAAKALGTALTALVGVKTLAAGAAVALGVAYYQASKETEAFNKALILTGNAAGQTVDGLADMAERIDGVVGTQSAASAALAEFAANGNIAGASLERFATVALKMERTTGQAVKETVKQFAELGKSPVEAAVKLNETTNFLTESTYKQIRALDAQGKTAEAAALAQQAYADAMDSRLGEINDRLGSVEKAWIGVKNVAAEAWDAMVDIQRPQTLQSQLDKAARTLESLQAQLGQAATTGLRTDDLARDVELQRQRVEKLQESQRLLGTVADRQSESAERVKARVEFDKESDKYISKRVQMEREIAKFIELGNKAGATRLELERGIAAIKEKYKDSSAEDIIAAKIAPAVEAAQLADDANFKEAKDLAEAQIRAIQEERKQVLDNIDNENNQAIEDGAKLIKDLEEKAKKSQELFKSLGLTFTSAFEDAIVSGKSFGDVLKGIEQDVIRIIARKTLTEPLAKGVANWASGINFGGLFGGAGASGNLDYANFDGGGFTGSGSRSGGLDGKGGFMAMLHPQETVIDHTRSMPMMPSGSGAQIVYSPVITIDSRTDRAEIAQLVDRTVRNGHAQLVDQLQRQGRI